MEALKVVDANEAYENDLPADVALDCKAEQIFYGDFLAVRDSHVPIKRNQITGFIGPSGCGKKYGAQKYQPP